MSLLDVTLRVTNSSYVFFCNVARTSLVVCALCLTDIALCEITPRLSTVFQTAHKLVIAWLPWQPWMQQIHSLSAFHSIARKKVVVFLSCGYHQQIARIKFIATLLWSSLHVIRWWNFLSLSDQENVAFRMLGGRSVNIRLLDKVTACRHIACNIAPCVWVSHIK